MSDGWWPPAGSPVWAGRLADAVTGRQDGFADLIAEGFEAVIDDVVSRWLAPDAPAGRPARAAIWAFQLSAETRWAEIGRAVAGRLVAADLGRRAADRWEDLPEPYQAVLGASGLAASGWEATRQAAWRAEDGRRYLTPDAAGSVEPEAADALWRLIDSSGRLAVPDGSVPAALASEDALGMAAAGAARVALGFTGFGSRFTGRSTGVASPRPRLQTEPAPHIGDLLVGLAAAGLGLETARDPVADTPPNRLAAGLRVSALALYGDYLMAEANRFGPLDALPEPGGPTDLAALARRIAEGEPEAGAAFHAALATTAFANLRAVRPGLDLATLTALHDAVSPGRREPTGRGRGGPWPFAF